MTLHRVMGGNGAVDPTRDCMTGIDGYNIGVGVIGGLGSDSSRDTHLTLTNLSPQPLGLSPSHCGYTASLVTHAGSSMLYLKCTVVLHL